MEGEGYAPPEDAGAAPSEVIPREDAPAPAPLSYDEEAAAQLASTAAAQAGEADEPGEEATFAALSAADEGSASYQRLGAEGLVRLRARYAEVMARIAEQPIDEEAREQLKTRAERLNPDGWVTADEVAAALEQYRIGLRRTARRWWAATRAVADAADVSRTPYNQFLCVSYFVALALCAIGAGLTAVPNSRRSSRRRSRHPLNPPRRARRTKKPEGVLTPQRAARGHPPQRRPGHHRRHRPRRQGQFVADLGEERLRRLRGRRPAGSRHVRADARRARHQRHQRAAAAGAGRASCCRRRGRPTTPRAASS